MHQHQQQHDQDNSTPGITPKTPNNQHDEKIDMQEDAHQDWMEFDVNQRQHPGDDIRAYYRHQWIDVKDSYGKWYEGQIIDIEATRVLVHYRGFKSKWDEWFDVTEAETQNRFDGLHSQVPLPNRHGALLSRAELQEKGLYIDAQDSVDKWYEAEIVDVKPNLGPVGMVKVHFIGWENTYDAWLDMDSVRILPHHTFTRAAKTDQLLEYNRRRHQPATATPTMNNERRFREILNASMSARIEIMGGDGNCLFRSVAHQVYGDQELHGLVRKSVVDYMESEEDFFQCFVVGDDIDFQQYLGNMRRNGCWGDHVEIQAMSEMYLRPIEVFAYSDTPLKTYRPDQTHLPPIRLSYHFRSHYNSIVNDDVFQAILTTETPGVLEKEAMERSTARKAAGIHRGGTGAQFEDIDLMANNSLLTLVGDLDAAMEASLLEFTQGPQGPIMDDMERALQASLMEFSGEDAAIQASFTMNHDFKDESEDPDLDSIPYVVQECLEIGFNLEQCLKAYRIFHDDRISPVTVKEQMTNYLLGSRIE